MASRVSLRRVLLVGRASREAGRRSGHRHRGQSLVEFTLVLPLFFLLVAGMVDFGMGLYSNMTVINAAREGARLSITAPGNPTAVEDRVRAMANGLNATDLTVTTTCQRPDPAPATTWSGCSSPQWQPGDAVVVKVDYVYHMIWPLAFGNKISMTSTVRMRIE
jgi:Flp pilus assembly protein TadG